MIAIQTPPIETQTALADRFISTEVERFTLVFPAVWIAEILRIDRSEILDLPFYDPLLTGIIHHDGQILPLIAAARLLKVEKFALRERLVVVRLNETAGSIANIGIIIDRAIGSSTRQDLPAEIFTAPTTDTPMLLMHPGLIPPDLWQPRR
ncbi:chemotaxis protein CheW [Chamaesiphon sp. VAR_48_metabat_135_sub]|uniref:chemotaxis protein CheW n=1 Tax=Chamaesiphon sp. VAR_48_metabat_135_sub TaxID=2964699 RepID=UPI00286B0448|nr:chemotaxis protein CheW [Chamaesiphon sp. VAR_48_metabat_135_sub]